MGEEGRTEVTLAVHAERIEAVRVQLKEQKEELKSIKKAIYGALVFIALAVGKEVLTLVGIG